MRTRFSPSWATSAAAGWRRGRHYYHHLGEELYRRRYQQRRLYDAHRSTPATDGDMLDPAICGGDVMERGRGSYSAEVGRLVAVLFVGVWSAASSNCEFQN